MSEQPEWAPEEREALESMRGSESPPAGLEDRLVDLLRVEGRLRPRRSRPSAGWLALAAAVTLFALGSGFGLGRYTAPGPVQASGWPRFALLLYGGTAGPGDDPNARAAEYGAWARSVAAGGTSIRGSKLGDLRSFLGPETDVAPPALRGFFVVEAPDLARALDLARGCPHLRYGGRIEVRPIDPT